MYHLARYIIVAMCISIACAGCTIFRDKEYRKMFLSEVMPGEIDREAFIARLDTTTVDDWEGLWLLMGPKTHCYLVIERLNDHLLPSLYTHRVRLWNHGYLTTSFELPAGLIVAYLEQSVYDDVRNVYIVDDIFGRAHAAFYAQMDGEKRRITLGERSSRKFLKEVGYGLVRIYPIRSIDEQENRVRYL